MGSGKRRAVRAFGRLDLRKKNNIEHLPGVLGVTMGGGKKVAVPGRSGYVYVRLRHNLSELIQAFNDQVSPVYGLPVLVKKDDLDPTRYVIAGRDLGVYSTGWGSSSYLPTHGATHSFWEGGGGDVVWVYDRQLMPLLVHPSGSAGACNVVIEPEVYYQDGQWKYGGNTGTADICTLKPTDNTAKMVLIYLDSATNPQLAAGSTFSAALTGTAQVMPFVPALPSTSSVPLAWVRLVSGTSVITWDNLYDARPWIVGDGVVSTGTSRHIIQDDGSNEIDRPFLNFAGDSVFVIDDPGNNRTNVVISGSAGSGGHTIQNEGTPMTDRTSLNFIGSTVFVVDDGGNDRTNVIISGSASGGWASGAKVRRQSDQAIPDNTAHPLGFATEIYDTDSYFTVTTGSSTRLTVPANGTYLIVGNVWFEYNTTGIRGIEIDKNGSVLTENNNYLSVNGTVALNVSGIELLNAGDYVELIAFQNSGGPLNALAYSTNFAIQRIG